jgi:hypothetical protein
MSEVSNDKPAEDKVGILRIYTKGGNVIALPRVTEVSWKTKASGTKEFEITQGGPAGGERLLTASIDLNQVEAMTFENPA